MRVLIVDSFDDADPDRDFVDHATKVLQARGHELDVLNLQTADFGGFMTNLEWRAYETDSPLLAAETMDSAERVKDADAMLFLYPTKLFGVCPRVKAWMERVLVPGVAFTLDDKQRLRPGMTNIRRIGAITSTPHSRLRTALAGDLGRRMVLRTVRLNCHPRCRSSYQRIVNGTPPPQAARRVARALGNW